MEKIPFTLPCFMIGNYYWTDAQFGVLHNQAIRVPVIANKQFTGYLEDVGIEHIVGQITDPQGLSSIFVETYSEESIVFTKTYVRKDGCHDGGRTAWRYTLKKDTASGLWVGYWKNADGSDTVNRGIVTILILPSPVSLIDFYGWKGCFEKVKGLFAKDEIPFNPNPPQVEIPPEERDEIFGTKEGRELYMAEIDAITGGDPDFFDKEIMKDAKKLRQRDRFGKKTLHPNPPVHDGGNEGDDIPF